jgi:hypothetical protein
MFKKMRTKFCEAKDMCIKQFLEKYGTDTTTNFQLLRWAKELGIKPFKILIRNELYKLQKTKKVYIIIIKLLIKEEHIGFVCIRMIKINIHSILIHMEFNHFQLQLIFSKNVFIILLRYNQMIVRCVELYVCMFYIVYIMEKVFMILF